MRDRWTPPNLESLVAVVAGASYGLGRSIAEVLGQCGATVYVTARSTRDKPSGDHRWSVEETAELVTASGGTGVSIRCDHFREREVERLFRKVRRLDLLVTNVFDWGGDAWRQPTWEQPVEAWDAMMGSVRAHFLTARAAIPRMLPARTGLIFGTSTKRPSTKPGFLTTVKYDVSSVALDRFYAYLGNELQPWGITAAVIHPGWPRTVNMPVPPRGAARKRFMAATESPHFTGRAIATLAADPRVKRKAGRTLVVGDVAREYGFTDTDGRQPMPSW